MSPEQARGLKVDARSDIFSLGVTLYEMLAGRRPFEGQTVSDVLVAVLTSAPAPLSRHNSAVAPELERTVLKCLAKEPEQRWQSAAELAAALKAALPQREAGAPVIGQPPTDTASGQVARRGFFKSRRGWLAVSLAALLLMLTLAFWRLRPNTSTTPAIKSLAVLPLENLSNDPQQEYFADGMTEALINNLAQLRALSRVSARTAVMRYKGNRNKSLQEIMAELKVDAVIEGTVQRAAGRVRVTAKLIPAATEAVLWSRDYDREESDVLKLQSEVARAVADEIRVQVTPEERARLAAAQRVDPAAHEAYQLGRYHTQKHNEDDLRQAIEHFERAIQTDPRYAAAWAGLSYAWVERGLWGGKKFREVESPARQAALKAIELDANLAEAHASLGHLKYIYDRDWAGAEQEIRRALELDPGNFYAHYEYVWLLGALGRHAEAIREIQIAEQRDPLSSDIHSTFGRVLYRARRYDEAEQHLKRAIELDPQNYGAYGRLGDVYDQMGRYPEAIANQEKAEAMRGGGIERGYRGYSARVAQTYARMGRRDEAWRMLEGLKATTAPDHLPLSDMAAAYAALGDRDEAFKLLFRMVNDRGSLGIFTKVDPPLDSLHSDPRWKDLLRRMNFPTE
jgi:TolB-like protein/lipoprotein NlpI